MKSIEMEIEKIQKKEEYFKNLEKKVKKKKIKKKKKKIKF